MRGGARTTKTDRQRQLDGSRKRPWQTPDPTFREGAPETPVHLTDDETAYWNYYAPMLAETRVLTLADRDALRLYCEALGQLDDLKQQQADPAYRRVLISTVIDGAGNEKVKADTNPLDAQRRQWHQIARLCAAELGLSPTSRARVSTGGDQAGSAVEEFRQERRLAVVK